MHWPFCRNILHPPLELQHKQTAPYTALTAHAAHPEKRKNQNFRFETHSRTRCFSRRFQLWTETNQRKMTESARRVDKKLLITRLFCDDKRYQSGIRKLRKQQKYPCLHRVLRIKCPYQKKIHFRRFTYIRLLKNLEHLRKREIERIKKLQFLRIE